MGKKKTGPKSLEDRTGEKTMSVKVLLTETQHMFVMSQPTSASTFMRVLVDMALKWRVAEKFGADLSSYDINKLGAIETRNLIADGELSAGIDWDNYYDSFLDLENIIISTRKSEKED